MAIEGQSEIRPYGVATISQETSQDRLCDILHRQARLYPQQIACVVLDRQGREITKTTYGELDRQARAVAAVMQRRARPGERALLAFPSGADFLVGIFACAYAGIAAVPVPFPGEGAAPGAARLTGIIADATPTYVLTTSEAADQPSRYGLSGVSPLAVARVRPELADEFQDPGQDREAVIWLQYTSGSTSDPKGVQISHRNALSNLNDIATTVPISLPDDDRLRIVSWLPLFHDMGLFQALLPVLSGGFVVLISPTSFLFRPVVWLEAMTRYRAHMSTAPNFGYDLCARRVTEEERRDLDLSGWQIALNGSEPVHLRTLELFARTFRTAGFRPAALAPGYGLAEGTFFVSGSLGAAGHLTVSVPALENESVIRPPERAEPARPVVSCGRVAAAIDVRIVDPDTHRECAAGRVGEIWVAGENVSRGYWRRPDERFGARLADGTPGAFLRTGDLGFCHGGELYVLGRLDDVIVVDGRNHYPQDIELTALESHRALAPGRIAAFGYPRDDVTEVAVVAETATGSHIAMPGSRVNPGQLDAREVIRAVRAAVAAEHQIRVAQVILLRPAGLPRTTSGKVRRRRCRELFLAGDLKTW